MNLVQFLDPAGQRRVASPTANQASLRVLGGVSSVYELALEALRTGQSLAQTAETRLSPETVSYDSMVAEGRLLVPFDHPDPARCWVSLTGLTHLGSAKSRDSMHAKLSGDPSQLTDSMKMFRLGLEGGKPDPGKVGAEPEWAFKGDGQCIAHPEQTIVSAAFAQDGGEEAELAGLYLIDLDGAPVRVGFALGNEFSDHVLERTNYLYLAHSKLRACSFGPELFLGLLPSSLEGTVRIVRDGHEIWRGTILTGEDQMCHSIANLEHHHFKYPMFRRPGDVHVHFFGASVLSCQEGVKTQPNDLVEIACTPFGRPLRNRLGSAPDEGPIVVHQL